MSDPTNVLREEFHRWVAAHNLPSQRSPYGFAAVPGELFDALQARIPEDKLRLVGVGLECGWLATVEDGRGYFVQETAAGSPPQAAVYHAGDGKVIPWWELYVQLADYVRIRSEAEPHGMIVRMEDRQMDITVWAGDRMLLYLENKVTAASAQNLLVKMRRYGESGFEMTDDSRGNDPLRKAMYLFQERCRPDYFGLSAIGYEELFRVEYLTTGNCFRLLEQGKDVSTVITGATPVGAVPERSPADSLAVALEQMFLSADSDDQGLIWLSPGKGESAFNAYFRLPNQSKDAIVVGVYRDGRLWSDVKAMGAEVAGRLAARLGSLGITLRLDKEWAFWRAGDAFFELSVTNVGQVAEAVAGVVSSQGEWPM